MSGQDPIFTALEDYAERVAEEATRAERERIAAALEAEADEDEELYATVTVLETKRSLAVRLRDGSL